MMTIAELQNLYPISNSQVRYISDDHGEVTDVILPIQLWQDILSELKTQHLRKSDTMWRRLLEAKQRTQGVDFEVVVNQLGLE